MSFLVQSLKFEFTGPNQILDLYTFVYMNKNWKNYWTEQSFTGLRLEDRWSLWGLVVIVRTGGHREDWWSSWWPVVIVKTGGHREDCLGQAQKCGLVYPPLLITGSLTAIHKQMIKTCTDSLLLKKTTYYTIMNNNINIDITIAGSMNTRN